MPAINRLIDTSSDHTVSSATLNLRNLALGAGVVLVGGVLIYLRYNKMQRAATLARARLVLAFAVHKISTYSGRKSVPRNSMAPPAHAETLLERARSLSHLDD